VPVKNASTSVSSMQSSLHASEPIGAPRQSIEYFRLTSDAAALAVVDAGADVEAPSALTHCVRLKSASHP